MAQWQAKQALDIGCYGIVFPHISTVEEAANAVGACRYPPQGTRSNGPIRAALYAGPGGYFGTANDEVLCIPMIETKEALDNLDAILDEYTALLNKYGHTARDAPAGARLMQLRMFYIPDEPAGADGVAEVAGVAGVAEAES